MHRSVIGRSTANVVHASGPVAGRSQNRSVRMANLYCGQTPTVWKVHRGLISIPSIRRCPLERMRSRSGPFSNLPLFEVRRREETPSATCRPALSARLRQPQIRRKCGCAAWLCAHKCCDAFCPEVDQRHCFFHQQSQGQGGCERIARPDCICDLDRLPGCLADLTVNVQQN